MTTEREPGGPVFSGVLITIDPGASEVIRAIWRGESDDD